MGVALPEQEQLELLGTHGTTVLTTVTPSGSPVPLPVWYVVVDGHFYIRTPRSAKRLAHIARNPKVAALVHAGEAWCELRGVLISGRAEIVEDEDEAKLVQEVMAERFADLLPPPLPTAVAAHYADTVVLRIQPVGRNTSWDNRKIRM